VHYNRHINFMNDQRSGCGWLTHHKNATIVDY